MGSFYVVVFFYRDDSLPGLPSPSFGTQGLGGVGSGRRSSVYLCCGNASLG